MAAKSTPTDATIADDLPAQAVVEASPEALMRATFASVRLARYRLYDPVIRRQGMHDRLWDAGKIAAAEWDWVERYALDCEIERGARTGARFDVAAFGRADLSYDDIVVMAATRLRLARERMSPMQREVVEAACVHAQRVGDVAVLMGILPRGDEDARLFCSRVARRVETAVMTAIIAGAGGRPKT